MPSSAPRGTTGRRRGWPCPGTTPTRTMRRRKPTPSSPGSGIACDDLESLATLGTELSALEGGPEARQGPRRRSSGLALQLKKGDLGAVEKGFEKLSDADVADMYDPALVALNLEVCSDALQAGAEVGEPDHRRRRCARPMRQLAAAAQSRSRSARPPGPCARIPPAGSARDPRVIGRNECEVGRCGGTTGMAFLKRANGDTAGQVIELKPDRIVIGRSPEHCHIVLDPNGVSRRHAEIYRKGEEFFLADLNSRNMTKVNNTKVIPGVDHRLKPGDRINICDVEFLFYPRLPTETRPEGTRGHHGRQRGGQPGLPHLHTLDASRSSAMASMVKPEVKLKAILEIARNLSSELKIDAVAPKILDSLMELFPQAERLFLVLVDPETKRLIRKAFSYRPATSLARSRRRCPADEVPMSISRSIVNHVLGQKKAVLSQDAGTDKNLPTSASIADLKIRSVMCVPLLTPDKEALGIIQLDTSDRKQFLQDDLDVLAAVAGQAAIAIQNAAMHESLLERERVDRDLKLAEQVQKRFLPQSVPTIPGFEFFAHYHPAYEVGGDYYDFVRCPRTGWRSPWATSRARGSPRR